jgi:uncharacterized protein YchJ
VVTEHREWPATAEALMRSRFAAHRDGDAEWVLASCTRRPVRRGSI